MGWRGMRSDYLWALVSFGNEENILKLIVVMVAQFLEYTKNY
jgi:hypothetical protein